MTGYILKVGSLKISNILQRKVSILGGTGSGKTTTLKLLALQAMKDGLHVFVFDPLNVINIEGFDKITVTKASVGKGKALGQLLNKLSHKKSYIISFRGLLQSELAEFINDVFSTWNGRDDLICFDEVHEFVPESGTAAKYAPEVERAIKHWRNQNCGFIMTSQRPAYVKKNVLALTDYLIVHRLVYPTDVKVMEEIGFNVLDDTEMQSFLSKTKTKSVGDYAAIDFRYTEV